jgi:hypothetical protein
MDSFVSLGSITLCSSEALQALVSIDFCISPVGRCTDRWGQAKLLPARIRRAAIRHHPKNGNIAARFLFFIVKQLHLYVKPLSGCTIEPESAAITDLAVP